MYSDDLAYIHHRGFTQLAAKVSPALMRLLRQHGIRGAAHRSPTIVEVGCGSGVLAARLDAAGYDVVGIDRSAAMIRLARATAPGARLRSAERRTYRRRVMAGDDWRIVLRATSDRTGRMLTRRMVLTRLVAGRARRSTETHRVRIYSRQEIGVALTAAGFRFEMRRFAAYRRIPGDLVVVASVSARMPP